MRKILVAVGVIVAIVSYLRFEIKESYNYLKSKNLVHRQKVTKELKTGMKSKWCRSGRCFDLIMLRLFRKKKKNLTPFVYKIYLGAIHQAIEKDRLVEERNGFSTTDIEYIVSAKISHFSSLVELKKREEAKYLIDYLGNQNAFDYNSKKLRAQREKLSKINRPSQRVKKYTAKYVGAEKDQRCVIWECLPEKLKQRIRSIYRNAKNEYVEGDMQVALDLSSQAISLFPYHRKLIELKKTIEMSIEIEKNRGGRSYRQLSDEEVKDLMTTVGPWPEKEDSLDQDD